MPPSRRNLIIIGCLCLLTIYVAASVRVYQSMAIANAGGARGAGYVFIPYAPYRTPSKPEAAFFEAVGSNKPVAAEAGGKTFIQQAPPQSPRVTAGAYIVGDMLSGKIYLEKNTRAVLPVASMSKLITAFVATDTIEEDTVVSISEAHASLPPDTSRLAAGEQMTLKNLLYPLLLNSSNVAAEAIASATDRNNFLELMSSYAWEVGMPSSFFADASGLSPQNAASARDLFALSQYLYNSRQEILAITRQPSASVGTTSDHGAHLFMSTHPFVFHPDFIGGKTGRTPEAGETMLTMMKISNRPIAVIVLGSEYGAREGDTQVLLDSVRKLIK
jgi:D-alanyl-D-alanine carboxypeptidase